LRDRDPQATLVKLGDDFKRIEDNDFGPRILSLKLEVQRNSLLMEFMYLLQQPKFIEKAISQDLELLLDSHPLLRNIFSSCTWISILFTAGEKLSAKWKDHKSEEIEFQPLTEDSPAIR